MKVALVTRRYPPLIGGAERVLSYLGPALAAEGLDVTVLTARIDPALPAVEVPRSPARVRSGSSGCRPRASGSSGRCSTSARWPAGSPGTGSTWRMCRCSSTTLTRCSGRRGGGASRSSCAPRAPGPRATSPGKPGAGSAGRSPARCRRADAVVAISPAVRGELEADGYAAAGSTTSPTASRSRHSLGAAGRLAPGRLRRAAVERKGGSTPSSRPGRSSCKRSLTPA